MNFELIISFQFVTTQHFSDDLQTDSGKVFPTEDVLICGNCNNYFSLLCPTPVVGHFELTPFNLQSNLEKMQSYEVRLNNFDITFQVDNENQTVGLINI